MNTTVVNLQLKTKIAGEFTVFITHKPFHFHIISNQKSITTLNGMFDIHPIFSDLSQRGRKDHFLLQSTETQCHYVNYVLVIQQQELYL